MKMEGKGRRKDAVGKEATEKEVLAEGINPYIHSGRLLKTP